MGPGPFTGGQRRPRVAAVVLAAGRSRRMGGANKLVVEVGGTPMVRRVAETALRAGLDPVVVVLGHEAARVRASLAGLPLRFVENREHASGMASSVRAGVRAIAGTEPSGAGVPGGTTGGTKAGARGTSVAAAAAEAAVIVLADMPWISASDLRALVDAFATQEGRGICVPVARGRRGNPVLWGARYFPALQRLEGDIGARRLLAEHGDDVREVGVAGDGVLRDIDTPAALDAARAGKG